MIRTRKRGRIYWMEIHHGGIRQQYSLKTRDREIADELRRQKELEILSGGGRTATRLWTKFIDEFTGCISPQVEPSTLRGYRYSVRHFSRFLETERIARLDQITPQVMAKYCTARGAQIVPATRRTVTTGGIKFDLRVLRRVFSFAVTCQYLRANPVAGFGNLSAEELGVSPFTQGELNAMLDAVQGNHRMNAAISVFLHTGMRISDIQRLEKTTVSSDRWEIKTRKRRKFVRPLVHPELRKALDAHIAAQNKAQIASLLLFTTGAGGPMKHLGQDLRRLFKRAGIKGHPHQFRHTFATRALEHGWTFTDIAQALGITEDVVRKHYGPFTPGQQQRQDQLFRSLDFNLQRNLPIQ